MKAETFHWEMRTILAQFEDAFNDVVIRRYNDTREPEDRIHVNYRFAPKQRVLEDIVNKNQHFKLPVVSIFPTGFRRDTKRVFNKLDGSYHTDSQSITGIRHLKQPVPVNVSINMSIISRFYLDVDQMLTNFVPYCDPYIVVSWRWPDMIDWADFEIRSHVIWSEDVSYETPIDIQKEQHWRFIANTSFTIETWMFKNSPDDSGPIHVIDTSFSSMSEIERFEVMKQWETPDNTEQFDISARPQFSNCNVPFLYTVQQPADIVLYGKMFDYTDSIFLSANNPAMFPSFTFFDPFSARNNIVGVGNTIPMSAEYPGFSGYELPVSSWEVVNQNILNATISAGTPGYFDVIAMNGAGYGVLSRDVFRETTNPYPSSQPEFFTYVEYQPPCISGIEVRS